MNNNQQVYEFDRKTVFAATTAASASAFASASASADA